MNKLRKVWGWVKLIPERKKMAASLLLPVVLAVATYSYLHRGESLTSGAPAVAAVETVTPAPEVFLPLPEATEENQPAATPTLEPEPETMEEIAERYGVSIIQIIAANQLTGLEVETGQELVIPTRVEHTVGGGESLEEIAERYGVSIIQIIAANQLTGLEVEPGQMLAIPLRVKHIVGEKP